MSVERVRSILLVAGIAVLAGALVLGPMDGRASDGDSLGFDEDARLNEVAEVLDLKDDVREQIGEISDALAEENAPRRAAIRRERLLLGSLLEGSPPDEAAVMNQVDLISAEQSALWKARLRAMMKVRALLTPRQREQLVQMRRGEARQSTHACREDVRALCSNATDMRTSVRCLIEHRDELSDGCRERLSQGRLSRFFKDDDAQ